MRPAPGHRTDGTLKYQPFVWDGANSELSRRRASTRLLELIQRYETNGERYLLIAHSHGGSVISQTLLMAARSKRRLDKLARWITVGTPFIKGQKPYLLFWRLGLLGKSAYLAIFTYSVMLFTLVLPSIYAAEDSKLSFGFGNARPGYRSLCFTCFSHW